VSVLSLTLSALPVSGQGTGGGPAAPAGATGAAKAPASDSVVPPPKAGSTPDTVARSSPTPQDSLGRPKSRADSVLVVKHSFNHRQQIITGSAVMSCLALMLVIMNNYNPR